MVTLIPSQLKIQLSHVLQNYILKPHQMSLKISRDKYANLAGPTTGDKIRLGDTDLIIEIEKDFAKYGDEIIFGGGKTARDGMGQSTTVTREQGALDLCITGAIIIDHTGIIKADVGIRDGKIVGIGKAG